MYLDTFLPTYTFQDALGKPKLLTSQRVCIVSPVTFRVFPAVFFHWGAGGVSRQWLKGGIRPGVFKVRARGPVSYNF